MRRLDLAEAVPAARGRCSRCLRNGRLAVGSRRLQLMSVVERRSYLGTTGRGLRLELPGGMPGATAACAWTLVKWRRAVAVEIGDQVRVISWGRWGACGGSALRGVCQEPLQQVADPQGHLPPPRPHAQRWQAVIPLTVWVRDDAVNAAEVGALLPGHRHHAHVVVRVALQRTVVAQAPGAIIRR